MWTDGIELVSDVLDTIIVDRASWSNPWKCKSGRGEFLFVWEQSQGQIKQRVGRLEP